MKQIGLAIAFIVSITSLKAQYCTPGYTTGCAVGDQIENFSTTGGTTNISNLSSGCSVPYTYFSTMTVSSVPTGTINFTVQAGTAYGQYHAIFIDWNNDQDFSDPGEYVWNTTTSSSSPFTGSFTVPATAVTGVNLRMRVRCQFTTVVADPCATYTWGETEDYNIFIAGAATNDAGVSAIVEPTTGCIGTKDVKVEIENFGINAIDSVIVHWSVNSAFQTPVMYNQTLDTAGGAGQSVDTVTLGTLTFVGSGTYNIRAWTVFPNNQIDTANYNDTSSASYVGTNFPTMSLGADTTLCPGDPVVLVASSSSIDSVLWSDNTKGNTRSVTTSGFYKATAYNKGCTNVDSINITIHPNPPSVNLGNDTTFCYGDIITLNATTAGVTYTWQDNSTSATYIADTSGLYWVILEDANTCKSGDSINLNLFNDPTNMLFVSPSTNICYGTPVTFTANGTTSGSKMYQLVINDINSGSPQISNVFNNPVVEHGDTVRVDLLTDHCASAAYPVPSNDLVMAINPQPILINGITADTVIENTKKSYAVALKPGSGYVWRAIGGDILGDSTSFAVQVQWNGPNANASLTLTERDGSNCEYDNVLPVNVISVVNVSEINKELLGQAYPNPADQSVVIPVNSDSEMNLELSLYDVTGKEVQRIFKGNLSGSRSFSIQVQELEEGMYFYKLTTADGKATVRKLLIQH